MSTILSRGTEPIISTESPSLEFNSNSRNSKSSDAEILLNVSSWGPLSGGETTARLEEAILDNDEVIETRRDNNESVRAKPLEPQPTLTSLHINRGQRTSSPDLTHVLIGAASIVTASLTVLLVSVIVNVKPKEQD